MLKKIGLYALAACIVIYAAIIIALHYYHKHQLAPKPNPNPKYFVIVSGNIEPHMPYPQTIMLRATYAGYNPQCKQHVSMFNASGLSYMPAKSVVYAAKPNKQGDYEIKVPIDAYQLGKCDWKIAWVMEGNIAKVPPKNKWHDLDIWSDMIRFAHYKHDPDGIAGYPVSTTATLYCGKIIDPDMGCDGTALVGGYAKFNVLRNKSYHFIQNIKNERSK